MIVDAIFGFSFKPPIRKPYDIIIESFINLNVPIFSIDIPSGWDVENGNTVNIYEPNYLISLGLPKKCVKNFKGKHYLGGRFIPDLYMKKKKWNVIFKIYLFIINYYFWQAVLVLLEFVQRIEKIFFKYFYFILIFLKNQ